MSDPEQVPISYRPPFYLPNARESSLEWTYRFFRGLTGHRLLRKGSMQDGICLYLCCPGLPPRFLLTFAEWRAALPSLYDFRRVVEGPSGLARESSCICPRDLAEILFNSEAAAELPELKAVVYEPAVIRSRRGLELTPPGFCPETGIFYYVPPDQLPIRPSTSTHHLETCFSAVPFESEAYRNNLFAWLLGAVLFDELTDPPMLVISGNQRGIGKSKTMESCGIILTGQCPGPIDHSADEFDKQLSARFRENSRFISIDNLVTGTNHSYKNDRLARVLTQGWSKKVRILGASRTIEQKGVLFALTANDCKLDSDLATRSLPIKLYAESPRPMIPFVRDYAFAHRAEIYAELLGLALLSVPELPPDSLEHPDFRFRHWLRFVQPRIAAKFGPLALDEARELDDSVLDLYSWLNDREHTSNFTSADVYAAMQSEPEKLRGLTDRFLSITSTRAKRRQLTMFLNQQVGNSVNVNTTLITIHLRKPGTGNSPPEYCFDRREIPSTPAPAPPGPHSSEEQSLAGAGAGSSAAQEGGGP